MEKSATCLEYLEAMKNELQGLNRAVRPAVATRRGPKIYYTRKTSGQASAPGVKIQKLPRLSR
jgi:hypothetical protein